MQVERPGEVRDACLETRVQPAQRVRVLIYGDDVSVRPHQVGEGSRERTLPRSKVGPASAAGRYAAFNQRDEIGVLQLLPAPLAQPRT